jgi:hypothetical protein
VRLAVRGRAPAPRLTAFAGDDSRSVMVEATHHGSCHCQKFRYRVTTDLAQVISCNCSMCQRKGHLLTFVEPSRFELLSGKESELSVYQFNKKVIHHAFCPVCGIASFSWGTGPAGKKMIAVNVRCLEDVDPKSLNVVEVDGKNH